MTKLEKPTKADDVGLTTSSEMNEESTIRLILTQLQKILSNPQFYATDQQRKFLQFVVNESVAGRAGQLKGYKIATQVFGRAQDFDPQIDPIVSIQANKLRRALEHYYLTDGKDDALIIDLPKGTYAPVFIDRFLDRADGRKNKGYPDSGTIENWPTLLILPFNNRTENPDKNYLCMGLGAELAAEISSFHNLRVMFPRDGVARNDGPSSQGISRFKLTGDVYEFGSQIKVVIHLEDTASGRHIWGDTYVGEINAEKLTQFQDSIVYTVALKVSGDFGIISRLISDETRHTSTTKLSTYEAILKFYEWEQSFSPESFKRSMEALTAAVQKEPDFGRLWTLLGIQYATIHNLGVPGFDKPLQKATEFIERGALLEPHCQRAVGSLAFIRFCNNELSVAITEADRALSLNPNSLFVLDGLAYVLILSGDWHRGVALAEKAIECNPYHRSILHDALWVNFLRVGKYNHAYHEAMYGRIPWLFWDPLIKGSTLGLLDQEAEGRKYAEKLLELRPDFPSQGRKLIRNYIKFEEIAELIEQGLDHVGIDLH